MALSANLLTFALGWVLSGRVLTSLVGHVRGWEDAELAAKRCSRIFMLSDLALISALVLLARATGSTAIAAVLAGIGQAPWAVTAAASALLVVAAAARCALPPFSHWLLRSLSTPTPVSALMHGGFVNAGGFLLLRFAPVMEAAPALRLTAVAIGLFAALYGVAAMSVRPDIKGALAASTVSQMGFMIASCGLGYYAAALWHLMAHGLFKGWLFLSSGSSAGIERNRPVVTLSGWAALSISTVTLVLGSILLRMFGEAPVPLLLAFATGAGVAVAARKSLRIIGAGALLVAAAAIGAESMRQWLLPSGPAPISAQAQLTIAAGMLGLWLALRFVAARGLPPALFVRLLNISSLKPAHSGAQA
jgi:NADH:ubiquinone oxidoreductase subunit 5 (subunit L)/multisubunit Na+/H+ antiporter MnhA subunit